VVRRGSGGAVSVSCGKVGRTGCVLSLALLGCVETLDGNGVLAEEARPQRGFEKVSSRGSLEVELTRGDFAVDVRIDRNLMSRVATSVNDGTLIIRVAGGNLGRHLPGPHVSVSMPALLDVELNGVGRLVASGFVEQETASVELSGAGEVSWSGSAEELDVVLNGSGELTLVGEAARAEYFLAGAGTLDARDLTASGAEIELEGIGSVLATVDGRVDANVDGEGIVELFGDVTRGTWTTTTEGSIIEH
jgi:Putative auto-transporter adhesin, head GIN domain